MTMQSTTFSTKPNLTDCKEFEKNIYNWWKSIEQGILVRLQLLKF